MKTSPPPFPLSVRVTVTFPVGVPLGHPMREVKQTCVKDWPVALEHGFAWRSKLLRRLVANPR
jgi:hypothetical protein